MQFTNLVESVARRFAGAVEPFEDLVQEGFIGLITAVDGYDAAKGVKFSTYATHFVIGQIKHSLRDRGKIIKEPAWLQELNQRVTRVIEHLTHELGRMPSEAEIGSMVGMTEDAVMDLLTTREVFKVASLDGGSENDSDQPTALDIDRACPDRAIEFEMPVEEKVTLETALNRLKQLEQTVIQEFYYNGKNQTEIARTLGISCNYVSHILRNSTRKLRKILVSDELKEAQTELALARKRLDEQARLIEETVVVDAQTRLYNRRYFDGRLDEELSRSTRHHYPVAILLVAVDGWDRYSRSCHVVKVEDTLRQLSNTIRTKVRRSDIISRFDECSFALILPYTGSQVSVVAERLGAALMEWIGAAGLDQGRAPLSVSIGHAVAADEPARADQLVAAALAAMETYGVSDERAMAA